MNETGTDLNMNLKIIKNGALEEVIVPYNETGKDIAEEVIEKNPWTVAILSLLSIFLFFIATQVVAYLAKISRLRIVKLET